ncbi:MAG: cytochrome P450 [Actinomycetes bacterium]|nr:MAG: cytochrome P450 [Actinomycetes bacterium]
MATETETETDHDAIDLDALNVGDAENWQRGAPHEIFRRLRRECPVHWSEITEYPDEAGFWSVVTAADVHAVSRDHKTFSSERGGCIALTHAIPLELMRSMFIAMDPPKHDRLKALFQRGFTPKRIAMHEDEIRAIAIRVLDRLEGRETCDIVDDIAQPVVSRVIGNFMGIAEEDDKAWATLMNTTLGVGDEELAPGGLEQVLAEDLPEIFRRAQAMIDDRRANPTDDLTSVLVEAEIDGEMLSDDEIIMGFFLLVAAGNDSTKATFTSAINALLDHPDQMRELVEDPSLIPMAIEECLRMYPAFANFRRTATTDTEIAGQPIAEGDKVLMWYVSSNRDEAVYDDPDRFDIHRDPEHQAFGGGGRHACLGMALARLELKVLLEEVLQRYPHMSRAGEPRPAVSPFLNQLKTLPVRLNG